MAPRDRLSLLSNRYSVKKSALSVKKRVLGHARPDRPSADFTLLIITLLVVHHHHSPHQMQLHVQVIADL